MNIPLPPMPELLSFMGLFLITFSFLPQTIQTLMTRETKGLNFIMYFAYVSGCLLMFVYGYKISNYSIMMWEGIATLLSATILCFKAYNMWKYGEK